MVDVKLSFVNRGNVDRTTCGAILVEKGPTDRALPVIYVLSRRGISPGPRFY